MTTSHDTVDDAAIRSTPDADAVDRLIAELRAWGIEYLTGGRDEPLAAEVAAHPLTPANLLRQLAACPEPSVRDATIALLLLHPQLAVYLPSAPPASLDATAQQLAAPALAATYLQREWRTRLALALGAKAALPARYWHECGLPDPDGEPVSGLRVLADRKSARTGRPFNYLAMWQQQVDHLTSQASRAHRRGERTADQMQAVANGSVGVEPPPMALRTAAAGGIPRYSEGARGMPHAPRGGAPMRMRTAADRERIERFLTRLGAVVHEAGRIYLVGSTTMVYEGLRATTVDIDLLVEANNLNAIVAAIRGLKDALDINVEFASPRDFIPLPAGWRERSIYVGRYGPIEVFHFDLYSMALSKIERGAERDFQDVVSLVQSGRIDPVQLDAAFHEILPRVATEGMAGLDPGVFAEHYRYLRSLLGAQP